jgi:hypothetical protein
MVAIGTVGGETAEPAGNSGQCATASLAFTATAAYDSGVPAGNESEQGTHGSVLATREHHRVSSSWLSIPSDDLAPATNCNIRIAARRYLILLRNTFFRYV